MYNERDNSLYTQVIRAGLHCNAVIETFIMTLPRWLLMTFDPVNVIRLNGTWAPVHTTKDK